MRNFLIRILQALLLLAVASSFAHADNFMYFKKKAAGGASCSPTTGDELTEGFESLSGSSGYEANVGTWTQTGSTIDNQATLAGSPPSNSCTKGINFSVVDAAAAKSVWDRGSTLARATTTDIVFDLYITSITFDDDFENSHIFLWANNATGGSALGKIQLYRTGATYNLRARNSDDSSTATLVPVSTETWYTVTIHFESTTSEAYFQVVGGGSTVCDTAGECKYTRTDTADPRYLIFGVMDGMDAGDSLNMTFGYVRINTP